VCLGRVDLGSLKVVAPAGGVVRDGLRRRVREW
jgi:hypothetical protein